LKDNFDYISFRNNFEDLKKISYTDLQKALVLYFEHL